MVQVAQIGVLYTGGGLHVLRNEGAYNALGNRPLGLQEMGKLRASMKAVKLCLKMFNFLKSRLLRLVRQLTCLSMRKYT